MSQPVITASVISGLYGKLPSRGDFLRVGLPRSFTDPWDEWLQAAMAASRAALGEQAWLDAWMEAPIWRFALPGGACGPDAVLGLWMPSVDKPGRHFPLTLALLVPGAAPEALAAAGAHWLDTAEDAGMAALERMQDPERLAAALAHAPLPDIAAAPAGGEALWWTTGSPFVPPTSERRPGLPDPGAFAKMIRERDKTAAPGEHEWEEP